MTTWQTVTAVRILKIPLKLLGWKVLPILNENDTISTEEIQFGDNDSLSAEVAIHTGADRLIILTDVDGLYDKNPQRYKDARLITHLKRVVPSQLSSKDLKDRSSVGTGGMYSKLLAASRASKAGIPTWLVRGDKPDILIQIAENKSCGTHIG